MNKWVEIIAGLVLIIVAILLWVFTKDLSFWDFGTASWEFLKGGIIWFVIMIGLLLLMLGISDLKN